MFYDGSDDVVYVFFGILFYYWDVYTEVKCGIVGLVEPEAWGIFHQFVPIGGDFRDKCLKAIMMDHFRLYMLQ